MVEAIVAGVVVLIIAGFWARRRSFPQWYREQRDADRAMKREDANLELDLLRKQVREVARARNAVIPVAAKGINPAAVEFYDGSKRYYFTDHARYVQAMRSGQVPPTRSFSSKPPVPVSRWTRDALKQWLAENSD